MKCPLCHSENSEKFHEDNLREYHKCNECTLIFVSPEYFLTKQEEKKRYDLHDNSIDDPNYRKFLSRTFNPVNDLLKSNSLGLDFGSGKYPVLASLFEKAGHKVEIYDYFYHPDKNKLKGEYDFITITEAVEHFHDPKDEIEKIWEILRSAGVLGIMTKLALNKEKFKNWHYIRDETHVVFFSKETFRWLAEKLNASLTFADKDVIILQKK